MRIGIVNDLRLAVESLKRAVATLPGTSVAWVATDGAEAVAMCARDLPDVVLMDMIMPVMDGVEATRRIMKATPCPIIVVTASIEGNSSKVFEALGAGALDAVTTPGIRADGTTMNADQLVRKIHAIELIAGIRSTSHRQNPLQPMRPSVSPTIPPFITIGASTGGPQAIAKILPHLPKPLPCSVVIVQHIDPAFAPGLAVWLSQESGHHIKTAQTGDSLESNRILLASTNDHLVLNASGCLGYVKEPATLVYRPSVDVFFDSVATSGAAPGVAVVLTGMGRDGASGLARLRELGWHTIAQNKATSVVWGMPGAAVELGAAVQTLPIEEISASIFVNITKLTNAWRSS